jgi:hypothetical protein
MSPTVIGAMSPSAIGLIGILIGGSIAIVGWFVVHWLTLRRTKQGQDAAREEAASDLIVDVLSACSTRAIYTRMDYEINQGAMNTSLANSRVKLQELSARIREPNQKGIVVSIIRELDAIERNANKFRKVDAAKKRIIKKLIKLSGLAHVPYELPNMLRGGYFHTIEEAELPPA